MQLLNILKTLRKGDIKTTKALNIALRLKVTDFELQDSYKKKLLKRLQRSKDNLENLNLYFESDSK